MNSFSPNLSTQLHKPRTTWKPEVDLVGTRVPLYPGLDQPSHLKGLWFQYLLRQKQLRAVLYNWPDVNKERGIYQVQRGWGWKEGILGRAQHGSGNNVAWLIGLIRAATPCLRWWEAGFCVFSTLGQTRNHLTFLSTELIMRAHFFSQGWKWEEAHTSYLRLLRYIQQPCPSRPFIL